MGAAGSAFFCPNIAAKSLWVEGGGKGVAACRAASRETRRTQLEEFVFVLKFGAESTESRAFTHAMLTLLAGLGLAAAGVSAGGAAAAPPAEPCSRALSREASLAASALQRAALAAGVAPAPACALQPARSMYAAQEAVKLRKKDKHWVCQACGRSFMGQEWVDAHLRDWHGSSAPRRGHRALPARGACLADHCGMLGCPGLGAGGGSGGGGGGGGEDGGGEGGAVARCESVLEECFPEAAALTAEGAAGGEGEEEGAAQQRRRAFYQQQLAALCHSTHAQRAQAWAAEEAAQSAFKWTPARAAGAVAAAAVFLWLLRAIVLEDIRNPIKGLKERRRERKAEEEAKEAGAAGAAADSAGSASGAAGGAAPAGAAPADANEAEKRGQKSQGAGNNLRFRG